MASLQKERQRPLIQETDEGLWLRQNLKCRSFSISSYSSKSGTINSSTSFLHFLPALVTGTLIKFHYYSAHSNYYLIL